MPGSQGIAGVPPISLRVIIMGKYGHGWGAFPTLLSGLSLVLSGDSGTSFSRVSNQGTAKVPLDHFTLAVMPAMRSQPLLCPPDAERAAPDGLCAQAVLERPAVIWTLCPN